ncbi:MAG: sodium:solute symporter family transporter, partial [Planctomycetota bacterium]
MTAMLAAGFTALDYGVLVTYLAGMMLLGAWFSRRENSAEDYFLAGRRIPWWAAGVSIFGTALSALTFMGVPARSYGGDWQLMLQDNAPLLLVPVVALVYIPFYRRLNLSTAYDYLQRRFNLACRWVGSLYYILFQFCRMAVILTLTAIALQVATGWDIYWCIAIMGALAAVYTVAGGIEAVIWTDLAQVTVLLGGAIFAVAMIAWNTEGGLGGIISAGAGAGK